MDIGIDLGTTFSVLAVEGKVDLVPDYPGGPGYYLEACDVTIIPSLTGENTFPSVMIPDPDQPSEWLFGAEAVQKADEGLAPVMFSKRKIGTTELISVETGMVTAKEVAGRFLRYLKQCAEQALGCPVDRAVITHPAYFDRGAVEETRDAARDAGFDMSLPQAMLMEPVAAALCYTRSDQRDPLRVLTYDLGGGTFDVTCLERRGGIISMQSFDGNHLLGGYNLDRAIVHALLSRLEQAGRVIRLDEDDPEDRGRLARLLRLAEAVKIKLSQTQDPAAAADFRGQNILVDEKGRPVSFNERFTRAQFVEAIQGYLNDILVACHRALEKAKMRPEDLHEVLLVGGSSRGPWVLESLRSAFPQATPRLFEPDLCVGAGAAIHARMALPRNLGAAPGDTAQYRITLDAPEFTSLEHIHIAGQVLQKSNGAPPAEALSVALVSNEGAMPSAISLRADGGFLFHDVPLTENTTNHFALRLKNGAGDIVFEQSFSTLQGGTSGVATTTTVLPRPLYVETARGQVALAEEGVALPARCVATFERANANLSMDIRLFQERDPVGLVRIKGIPPEAGVGSPVVLSLEITADNRVHGDVIIYTVVRDREGAVVDKKEALRGRIDVSFDPAVIPGREELEDQFANARQEFATLPEREPDFAEEIQAQGDELVARVEGLLAAQIVDRQEVHASLRALRHLLEPPKDEMSPSRLEFKRLVRNCRGLLQAARLEAQARIEADSPDGAGAKGKALAERLLKHLPGVEEKLGAVEQEGVAAHEQKNRSVWESRHAALVKIGDDLETARKRLTPEDDWDKRMQELLQQAPFLLKIVVLEQEIKPLKEMLRVQAIEIHRKGALEVWQSELEDINRQLDAVAASILAIDDNADAEQIRAKIHVYLQSIKDLRPRIKRLQKDLH